MSQVFISYAKSDLSFLEKHVVGVCRNAGYEPWYDKEGINPGERWERIIVKAIMESDWFLVLMSPESAASEYIKDELHQAFREGKIRVIPLMIKDCDPIDFHGRLDRTQYIDFRGDASKGCQKLAKFLTGMEQPPPPKEMDVTSELISLAASLLPRHEVKHLKNLALGRTQYTGCSSMRHEIRHLCDLGLLRRKKNRQIAQMTDESKFDLSAFVEFTPVGELIAKKLPGVQKA